MRLRRTMFGRWTRENGEGIEDIFFHSEGIDRTFFLKKGKQSDILQGKTERKDRKKRFVNKK